MKKRIIVIAAALVLVFAVAFPAFAAQVAAWSEPTSLTGTGDATLSLKITNTGASVIDNISITNANGLNFDTAGISIPAGTDHTFSKRVTVPYELIGKAIEFKVSYNEGGESKSGTASVTIQLAGAVTDTPTATPDPVTGVIPPVTTAGSTAQITATRSVSATQASPGDQITLKYVLTNTGVTDVSGISITDKEIGGRAAMAKDITIAAGQSYTYEHIFTMGTTTVASAPVISYMGADGVTPVNVTVAEKVLGMVNTKLSFTAEQGTPSAEGVTFTLFLTNNGNQKISKLKIVDEKDNTVASDFSLAIGESKSVTYTVPTDAARNVVFYVTGVDATNESYADNSQTFEVREYIDPSMIGVDFQASVIETLNSGSIRVLFTVLNTGSLTMTDLVLSEAQLGDIYNKESLPAGTENIEQNVYIGEPRELTFTLSMKDPAGNPFSYTAYISAEYVGVDASDFTEQPNSPSVEPDIIDEVGSTISDTLKTILIVLAILTVIACAALLVLTNLERAERRRLAKRRAQRERMREHGRQAASFLTSGSDTVGTGVGLETGVSADSGATAVERPIRRTSTTQSTSTTRQMPSVRPVASPRRADSQSTAPSSRPRSANQPNTQAGDGTSRIRTQRADTRASAERDIYATRANTQRPSGDVRRSAPARPSQDTQAGGVTRQQPRVHPRDIEKSTDATRRLPRRPED